MKRFTFLVPALLLILAVGPAFAGGGKQRQSESSSQTLKVFAFEGGYGRAYWDDMVARFQAANPGITVELTADPEIGTILTTQSAAGQWPDVVYLAGSTNNTSVYIKNRELLDITDIFDQDAPGKPGTKLRDYVIDGLLESTACSPYGDGRIYQAPYNSGPWTLVYNKTLFDSKGWKVPATWDEFFALGEELKKPENYVTINGRQVQRALFTYQGLYPYYIESVLWPAIAGAGGPSVIKAIKTYQKGAFSSPAVRQVLEQFVKLGTGAYLMEGTVGLNHTQSQADMMIGKALFIPCGVWMEDEMADAPREAGFSFAMAPAPVLRSGQDRYVISSHEEIWIPTAAKNIPLAKEFIKSLYSDESVVSLAKNAAGVLAVKNAAELGKAYLSAGTYGMFSVYNSAGFMLMDSETLPESSRINPIDIVLENIGSLITGAISVDDYIKMVDAAFAEVSEDKARAAR
jgi:N-acetylglucosamine transport system substrate-binding protein